MTQNRVERRWRLVAQAGLVACLLLVLRVAWGVGAPVQAQGAGWPTVELQPLPNLGDLLEPVDVQDAGDGSGRLFFVEQGGRIRIYQNGALLPTPFLDLSGQVSTGSEQGLLGLAFSPSYETNGEFYVNYTDLAGDTRVVRYEVSADPNVADPNSAEVVLPVDQPYSNHNAGQLQFGPDGFLYVGLGDGGGGGDPDENGQDPAELLGKMLRLDVETGEPLTYTIPSSNPFTQTAGYRGEIWQLGLRNPWRYAFDSATGDLYIADVGQGAWEEVDVQLANSSGGENWGWDCYEGNHPFEPVGCGPQSEYTFPVWEYANAGSHCAITGGYVYRGSSYPVMQGIYFYGDYCSGTIWGLRRTAMGWENTQLADLEFGLTTFGEDEAGNLYVAQGNTIYRIVETSSPTAVTLERFESGTPAQAGRGAVLGAGLALALAGLAHRARRR